MTISDFTRKSKIKIRANSKNDVLVNERRLLIAHVALDLFLKNGYKGTTTKKIAKGCKLTEAAIYRYIGSKRDILHLLMPTSDLNFIEYYARSLGEIKVIDEFIECFQTYFVLCDLWAKRNTLFNRELINFEHNDRVYLLKTQIDYSNYFERLIKRGIDDGQFKCDNALLLAHDIIITGHDWGLRQWFLKNKFTLKEYIEFHTKMFLQLLDYKCDEWANLIKFKDHDLGIVLNTNYKVNRIKRISPNSPSEKAGVKRGDILIEINGYPTSKMIEGDEYVWMRGITGSKLLLRVIRPGLTDPINIEVIRT